MNIELWQHKPQGKDWKTEKAKSRAEFYVKKVMSFGMSEVDAQCMINDLYWDCYAELKLSGAIKEGWKND